MIKQTLMAALLLAPIAACAGEYFKWVDENGVTRYAEKPPAGVQAEKVNTHAGSTSKYDPSEAIATSAEARKEQEHKAEVEAKVKQHQEQLKEQCDKTEEYAKTLKERPRIKVRSEDGTERYLSPEEQADKIVAAENFLAENCSDTPPQHSPATVTNPGTVTQEPPPATEAEGE